MSDKVEDAVAGCLAIVIRWIIWTCADLVVAKVVLWSLGSFHVNAGMYQALGLVNAVVACVTLANFFSKKFFD